MALFFLFMPTVSLPNNTEVLFAVSQADFKLLYAPGKHFYIFFSEILQELTFSKNVFAKDSTVEI